MAASRRTEPVLCIPLPHVLDVPAVRASLAPHEQSLDDAVAQGAEVGVAPAAVAVPRAAGLAQGAQADGAVGEDHRGVQLGGADLVQRTELGNLNECIGRG